MATRVPLVPIVDVRRDCRFPLEEQWEKQLAHHVAEGFIPTTVFDPTTGQIVGWVLHGERKREVTILWDGREYDRPSEGPIGSSEKGCKDG